MNKELNKLRNRYADRIIDNITNEDNWTAKGVIDIMKEYEHSLKLLHMQSVSNNEVKLCCDCKTQLKDGFANRCPECWGDIYFPK